MAQKTFRPLTDRVFQRLAETIGALPVIAGILASLTFGLLSLWVMVEAGVVAAVATGAVPDIAVRAPVTLYVMIGYLPMALYYLGVWTARHHEAISKRFSLPQSAIVFPRRAANLAGAAGSAAMYILFLYQPDYSSLVLEPSHWSPDFVLALVGLLLMGWFYFRFMFLLVWNALVISRTAEQIGSIDLLDTDQVKPFAQQGVRSSLLAIVSLSISANLWLDTNSPIIGTAASIATLVMATVVALVLPTWGIHRRLKAQKVAELRQLRTAIASRRNPQTRSLEDAQHLPADLALEKRLMDASEWPFDAGSYGRVTLYILLGLGSWVGAALVERLLDTTL